MVVNYTLKMSKLVQNVQALSFIVSHKPKETLHTRYTHTIP